MATRNPLHPASPGLFRHPHGAQVFFSAWSRAVARAAAMRQRNRPETPEERERALLVASGVWGMVVGRWTLAYASDLLSDAALHNLHGEGEP